jgi:hypothetical protein
MIRTITTEKCVYRHNTWLQNFKPSLPGEYQISTYMEELRIILITIKNTCRGLYFHWDNELGLYLLISWIRILKNVTKWENKLEPLVSKNTWKWQNKRLNLCEVIMGFCFEKSCLLWINAAFTLKQNIPDYHYLQFSVVQESFALQLA